MSAPSTLDPTENSALASHGVDHAARRLRLVVIHAHKEPHLLGASFTPANLQEGEARWTVVGRIRSDAAKATAALPTTDPSISRQQLRCRMIAGDAIEVEQRSSKRRLLHLGQVTQHCEVHEGDLLEIERRFLFLCVGDAPSPMPGSADRLTEPPRPPFGEPDASGIVGESAAICALRRRIAAIGADRGHVLILGPSGSGKELVAQGVHAAQGLGNDALVSRSAATLPEGLADAELFGNARDFPQAGMPARPGLIGEADGGSLFLDEAGELSERLQTRLLRVLDSGGEYQRLGETRARASSFRLIAATNRPLSHLRADFAARFPHVVHVPSLNERQEDIPLIARHLLRGLCRGSGAHPPPLAPELAAALVVHAYTTGVRELASLLRQAVEITRPGAPVAPSPQLKTELERWYDSRRRLNDWTTTPETAQVTHPPPDPSGDACFGPLLPRLNHMRRHRFDFEACARDPRYPLNSRDSVRYDFHALAAMALTASQWTLAPAITALIHGGNGPPPPDMQRLTERLQQRVEEFLHTVSTSDLAYLTGRYGKKRLGHILTLREAIEDGRMLAASSDR